MINFVKVPAATEITALLVVAAVFSVAVKVTVMLFEPVDLSLVNQVCELVTVQFVFDVTLNVVVLFA